VKVDGQYYRDVVLCQQTFPAIKRIAAFAGDTFVFQQDSAPAHHAHDTTQLLLQTPDFIAFGPDLWPPIIVQI